MKISLFNSSDFSNQVFDNNRSTTAQNRLMSLNNRSINADNRLMPPKNRSTTKN